MKKNSRKKKSDGALARALETWFARVKRPMPWRLAPSPYACWLSEIMLQQTTYATVLPYYERFLAKFASVEILARANEADVLKAWEGLGYYARARNLHRASREIVARGWPQSAHEWQQLSGVGAYTAAALASVLNRECVSVVDGNVARVFSRVWQLADDFKKIANREKLATRLNDEIIFAKEPGDFNQAMMELGALVCTPTNPACAMCPLAKICRAKKSDTQMNYPIKIAKKETPIRETQVVIVSNEKGEVLLAKNFASGLLKGLWELPVVEKGPEQTHIFSHFRQEMTSVRAIRSDAEFRDPHAVPLATTTRKILREIGLLARDERQSK